MIFIKYNISAYFIDDKIYFNILKCIVLSLLVLIEFVLDLRDQLNKHFSSKNIFQYFNKIG